jgi:LmeA-like phospholipid-binding
VGESNLGDQAIGKAVEMGLTTQLDEVEALKVKVETNPIALVQGELDSVAIEGTGLVMKQDLRTEKLVVQSDGIAVNPLKAAFGQIELVRPTTASALMVLTEADIERAFNSDYIKGKLQGLTIDLAGQPTKVNTEQIEFRLPGEGKVAIAAHITLVETGEQQRVAFSAVPQMAPSGQQVMLQNIEADDALAAPQLTDALARSASDLLDLRNFDLDGLSLCLNQVDVRPGEIELKADARIEKFPAA